MYSHQFNRATKKARSVADGINARLRIRWNTRHLSGPGIILQDDDDVALVCMLKNGAYYIDELLTHHRALGIRNFLFIDNGSDDRTREMLAGHPYITVVINTLPVATHEALLRSQIARRFIKGGWFLFVDSDELIDMVNATGRTFRDYARYCNDNEYDAVVGQCLDLFSDLPLSETLTWDYAQSIQRFDRYSLNAIKDFSYHDPSVGFSWFLRNNTVSNPQIHLKFGGIRKELFGENCALTNHRMVKNAPDIEIYSHPHCSSNIRCADFTLLLRHYKFAGNFAERERAQVAKKVWQHGEDRNRIAVVQDSSFRFACKQAYRFRDASQLAEQNFLTCSKTFYESFPPVPRSQEGS
ncbi:glycosyltransferase family 2 protein [Salipiger sp. IMCC34102]|uniref:glycosyltransferase family 2 protein n=1 Tax=Salipiger sp. IMCC34102 TaxID=2510647 RepID=UPI00101CBA68|nr:glycosyltransferase family 2 protein [Salipiger sp. IMCC34102]RYH01222.1 glycosyltransferase family 2 protein [Salipiger sp. IMCC34102]